MSAKREKREEMESYLLDRNLLVGLERALRNVEGRDGKAKPRSITSGKKVGASKNRAAKSKKARGR